MDKISIDEFISTRLVIEKAIISEVIDNAQEEDLARLREHIEKQKGLIVRRELTSDPYYEFHSLLAMASKNKVYFVLERAINAIHHEMRPFKSVAKELEKAVKGHEQLLDAIIRRDKEEAFRLLEAHVKVVSKTFYAVNQSE